MVQAIISAFIGEGFEFLSVPLQLVSFYVFWQQYRLGAFVVVRFVVQ